MLQDYSLGPIHGVTLHLYLNLFTGSLFHIGSSLTNRALHSQAPTYVADLYYRCVLVLHIFTKRLGRSSQLLQALFYSLYEKCYTQFNLFNLPGYEGKNEK